MNLIIPYLIEHTRTTELNRILISPSPMFLRNVA